MSVAQKEDQDNLPKRIIDAVSEIPRLTFDRSEHLRWESSKLARSFELRMESQQQELANILKLYGTADLNSEPPEAKMLMEILAYCKDVEAALASSLELRTKFQEDVNGSDSEDGLYLDL
mmetsp:Transcript_17585/g.23152  ORF Transcript_17585/g.23152 Transcript_17585/m.23152 type:complete len:120 (-) Transcript_17585:280-639(-)